MTFDDLEPRTGRYFALFRRVRLGASYVTVVEIRPIYSSLKNLVFGNMTYDDILRDYWKKMR